MLMFRAVLHLAAVVALSAVHVLLWQTLWSPAGQWFHAALLAANGVALCFFYYTLGFLMHEGSHYHLAKNRLLNEILFYATGFPTYGSPALYRAIHFSHHGFTNYPQDLELLPESRMTNDPRRRRRRILKLALLAGIERGHYHYGILFSRNWRELPPEQTLRIRRELLAMLGLMAAIAVAWTWWLGFTSWLTGYALPVVLCVWAHGWQQMCEHYGMAQGSGTDATRDVMPRGPISKFIYWMMFNVNYHAVHHAWPFVPAGDLPKAHRDWVARLREKGEPEPQHYGSYTEVALKQVLPLMLKQYRETTTAKKQDPPARKAA